VVAVWVGNVGVTLCGCGVFTENISHAQLASSQAASVQHSHTHLPLHGSQQQLHLSHQSHAYSQPRRDRRTVGQVSPDKNGSRMHRQLYNQSSSGHSSDGTAAANSSHQDGIRVLANTEPSLASSQIVLRSAIFPPDFTREKRRKSVDMTFPNEQPGDRHGYAQNQRSKVNQEQSFSNEDKRFVGSQKWDGILHPEDIVIALNDDEKNKSSSSSHSVQMTRKK